jgi:hypothetical protein
MVVVDSPRGAACAYGCTIGIRSRLGARAIYLHSVLTLLFDQAIVDNQCIEIAPLKRAERIRR